MSCSNTARKIMRSGPSGADGRRWSCQRSMQSQSVRKHCTWAERGSSLEDAPRNDTALAGSMSHSASSPRNISSEAGTAETSLQISVCAGTRTTCTRVDAAAFQTTDVKSDRSKPGYIHETRRRVRCLRTSLGGSNAPPPLVVDPAQARNHTAA